MAKRGSEGTRPPRPPQDKRQVYIPPDIRQLRNPEIEGKIRREINRLNNRGK